MTHCILVRLRSAVVPGRVSQTGRRSCGLTGRRRFPIIIVSHAHVSLSSPVHRGCTERMHQNSLNWYYFIFFFIFPTIFFFYRSCTSFLFANCSHLPSIDCSLFIITLKHYPFRSIALPATASASAAAVAGPSEYVRCRDFRNGKFASVSRFPTSSSLLPSSFRHYRITVHAVGAQVSSSSSSLECPSFCSFFFFYSRWTSLFEFSRWKVSRVSYRYASLMPTWVHRMLAVCWVGHRVGRWVVRREAVMDFDSDQSLKEWAKDKPLSILQLDPADRAVLRIAGKFICIFNEWYDVVVVP